MRTTDSIGHEGIVERVINGAAFVSFRHTSGCSGCSVKSSCGMAESTDKIFRIPLGDTKVNEGDEVTINISLRNGYKAVIAGYLIPFALVLISLSGAIALGMPEPVAGLISLATLIPYYILLKVLRKLFSNDLSIEVQKQ
jgi:positive regulator of sigma E activity